MAVQAFDYTAFLLSYEIISMIVGFVFCGLLTLWVMYFFTKKNPQNFILYIILGLTYFINFCSLVLISIDISTSKFVDETATIERKQYLVIMWKIVYWAINFLAWIFVPIAQSYVEGGYFNFFRNLIFAVYDNLKFYVIVGAIGGVALTGAGIWMYFEGILQLETLTKDVVITLAQQASNAFGIVMLVGFLGYGLGVAPSILWYTGSNKRNLKYYQFKVAQLTEELEHHRADLETILKDISLLNETIPENDKLRYYINIVDKKAKVQMEKLGLSDFANVQDENAKPPTYSRIVALNKALYKAERTYHKVEYEIQYFTKKAFFAQDLVNNETNPNKRVDSPFRNKKKWYYKLVYNPVFGYLEWLYYTKIARHLFRFATILFLLWGVIIMYDEMVFPIVSFLERVVGLSNIPHLSVFYWCVKGLGLSKINVIVQVFSFVTVFMIGGVACYGMFKAKIKFMDMYNLIPHATDDASLLFSAVFLCRVVPTLCYNYLQLVGVKNTDAVAYYQVMTGMVTDKLWRLQWVGGIFADYTPFFMLIVFFLSITRIPCWLCYKCGVGEHYYYTEKGHDAIIKEGAAILELERKKQLRLVSEDYVSDEEDEEANAGTKESKASERRKKTTDEILEELYAKRGKVRGAKKDKKSSSRFGGDDDIELDE